MIVISKELHIQLVLSASKLTNDKQACYAMLSDLCELTLF